ncbi:MAG: hypothetical protein ACYTHM_23620, partial [Planctomycetota bacterium]
MRIHSSIVAGILLAFLPACGRVERGETIARFVVMDREMKAVGEVTFHPLPDTGNGIFEIARIGTESASTGMQWETRFERTREGIAYRTRRWMGKHVDTVEIRTGKEGNFWVARRGLAVSRASPDAGSSGILEAASFGDEGPAGSVATWASLVRELDWKPGKAFEVSVVSARHGHLETLRIEERERRTLRLEPGEVEGIRLFAWTPATG